MVPIPAKLTVPLGAKHVLARAKSGAYVLCHLCANSVPCSGGKIKAHYSKKHSLDASVSLDNPPPPSVPTTFVNANPETTPLPPGQYTPPVHDSDPMDDQGSPSPADQPLDHTPYDDDLDNLWQIDYDDSEDSEYTIDDDDEDLVVPRSFTLPSSTPTLDDVPSDHDSSHDHPSDHNDDPSDEQDDAPPQPLDGEPPFRSVYGSNSE